VGEWGKKTVGSDVPRAGQQAVTETRSPSRKGQRYDDRLPGTRLPPRPKGVSSETSGAPKQPSWEKKERRMRKNKGGRKGYPCLGGKLPCLRKGFLYYSSETWARKAVGKGKSGVFPAVVQTGRHPTHVLGKEIVHHDQASRASKDT